MLALIVVVLAGLGMAGCGHSPPADRFAGWWASSDGDSLHIVLQNGRYLMVPTNPKERPTALTLQGATLSGGTSSDGQVKLILSPDGAHLTARFSQGTFATRATYHHATKAEIDDFIQQANENRLAGAIRRWRWNVGSYPAVADVRPGGAFQEQLRPWPTNPYTGKPMAPGTQPGEYRYRFTARGFSLAFAELSGSSLRKEDAPGWLGGLVTVSQGSVVSPAANARVLVRFNFGSKAKPYWTVVSTATTDHQGRFEMTRDAGAYTVTVTVRGVGRSLTKSVTVKSGGHSHVTLLIAAQ